MSLKDAIESAVNNHDRVGGVWHVVQLDSEYYDVSEYWMDKFHAKSLFMVGNKESFFERKRSVIRKIIFKFNLFLLWFFRPLINGRRNKGKT